MKLRHYQSQRQASALKAFNCITSRRHAACSSRAPQDDPMPKKKKFKLPRPNDRQALLFERRNMKMAESAHAYVRGSTTRFYEWLDGIEGHTLPEGPAIWICGDCHTGNLGPIANAKGRVEIQIRDLDQTVIGNPAHDIIRLGLSLATV